MLGIFQGCDASNRERLESRVRTLFREALNPIGHFRILGEGGTGSAEANCYWGKPHRR
jgi:hypothetical protein